MTALGMVSVTAATIVKVVAVAGMALFGLALMWDALTILLSDMPNCMKYGEECHSLPPNMAAKGLGFVASLGGWKFADWVDGRAHVMENKARQEAELKRLESYHGVAL